MNLKSLFLAVGLFSLSINLDAQTKDDEIQRLKNLLKECEEARLKTEQVAIQARAEADRRRYWAIALELASKSKEVTDKELSALLALQAYQFNLKCNGYSFDSKIYDALFSALNKNKQLPKKLADDPKTYNWETKDFAPSNKEAILTRISNLNQSYINKVSFSHSGKFVATMHVDSIIRIWNLANMWEKPIQLVGVGRIEGLTFSVDDSQLLTLLYEADGNKKPLIHSWPVKNDEMAKELCGLVSRNMNAEEWGIWVSADLPIEIACVNRP